MATRLKQPKDFLSPSTRALLAGKFPKFKAPKPKKEKREFAGEDRRKRPRITLEELNKLGEKEIRENLAKLKEPEDRRSTITKVLDFIDIPRNLVANAVASLSGADTKKLEKGALGLKRVNTSDLLKQLGVENKVARGILGFVGDVALDPLTYASLGATTGLSLGRHVPKLLKPGRKMMETAARTMAKGGLVPKSVAKALGRTPEQLARIGKALALRPEKVGGAARGVKAATMQLMKKQGGILTNVLAKQAVTGRGGAKMTEAALKASRGFLGKFGEKGRTLFRAPFAASGITSKWGRRARLAKEFAGAVPEIVTTAAAKARKVIKQTAAAARKTAQAAGVSATIKKGVESAKLAAGKKTPLEQAALKFTAPFTKRQQQGLAKRLKMLRSQGEKLKVSAGKAGAERLTLLEAKGAPESLKGLFRETVGPSLTPLGPGATRIEKIVHDIRSAKRKYFGPGESAFRQQELAGSTRATFGRHTVAAQTKEQMETILRPYVDDVTKKLGVTANEVDDALTNLVEKGGTHLPDDPIRADLGGLAARLAKEPGTEEAIRAHNEIQKMSREASAAVGLPITKPGKIPESFRRVATPEFAEATRLQEARGLLHPFKAARTNFLRYQDGAGDIKNVLSSNADEIKRLQKAGYKPTGDVFDISTKQWNVQGEAGGFGQKVAIPDFKGKRYQTSLSESAAKAAGDAEMRGGMAELRDLALKNGVRLDEATARSRFPNLSTPILKDGPMKAILGPQLEGHYFPRAVTDMLERQSEILGDKNLPNVIGKSMDWLYAKWKGFALMHPAYVTRNVFDGFFGGVVEGVNPVRFASRAVQVKGIVKKLEKGQELTGFLNIAGKRWGVKNWVEQLRKVNQVNSGFTSQLVDMNNFQRSKNLLNKGFGTIFRMNNRVENSMKMGLMLEFMDRGMDVKQAAMKVIRAMPDLTNLTLFERNVMKRIFPWYSWMRRNGSRIVRHTLMEKPAFLTGPQKFGQALQTALVGDNIVDPSLRPEWMGRTQPVQVMGDKEQGKVWLLGSWFPFEELLRGLGAAENPQQFMRFLLEQSRPEIKFATQLGVGADIFKQQPVAPRSALGLISDIPGAVVGATKGPVGDVAGIRALKEIRRVSQQPDVPSALLRAGLGGAFQTVNREQGLRQEGFRLRQKIRELRSAINRARQVNDVDLARSLTQQWVQTAMRLQQLNLRGVPAATQGLFAREGVDGAQR